MSARVRKSHPSFWPLEYEYGAWSVPKPWCLSSKESACNAGAQGNAVQSLGPEDPLEGGRGNPPVFLPGESNGQRSLAGYSPWGRREVDMTEAMTEVT